MVRGHRWELCARTDLCAAIFRRIRSVSGVGKLLLVALEKMGAVGCSWATIGKSCCQRRFVDDPMQLGVSG